MTGVSELLVGEMIQVVQLIKPHTFFQTFKRKVLLVVKDPTAKAGDTTDTGSTPWWGRSLGEGNGNSLQYSYLENSMDRRAWQSTVHGVAKSWTRLDELN